MHIPDGFLSAGVFAPAWAVSSGGIFFCFRKIVRVFKDKTVPLMGVASAFVFAAQMINFPVAGGTSGHLLGGVLAAVLLGPAAGAVAITIVLIAQCFLFQDGGLTALGANVFNMAVVGTAGAFFIYRFIRGIFGGKKGVVFGAVVASWSSVVLASACCALELAASGTSPLKIVLPAMVSIHAVIGIGEAAITALIVNLILKVRPDLIYEN